MSHLDIGLGLSTKQLQYFLIYSVLQVLCDSIALLQLEAINFCNFVPFAMLTPVGHN